VNIGIAWVIGLFLDLLTGTVLGVHALGLCLVAYLMVKFRAWMQIHTFWHQFLIMITLLIIYKIVIFLIEGLSGHFVEWYYGISVLTSALIWPPLFYLLQGYQSRFQIKLR
jgi:rod shape-determining protein MreD